LVKNKGFVFFNYFSITINEGFIKWQIDYWINGAKDDLLTAEVLIQRNRYLHGLFFCHLVVEKAIKAHVVKTTKEIAPRTHNLILLSEKAKIEFESDDDIFLGILMKYQLQGRYPDYNPSIPEKAKIEDYLT
jgi:HEPN domain-containing protein